MWLIVDCVCIGVVYYGVAVIGDVGVRLCELLVGVVYVLLCGACVRMFM